MSAININKNNFQNEIMDSEKTVLLDFWAPWCAPCRMVVPIMRRLQVNALIFKFGKINVDEQPELTSKFGIEYPNFGGYEEWEDCTTGFRCETLEDAILEKCFNEERWKNKMKVIIVGGVAGGATAAARIRRLDEHAEITVFEKIRDTYPMRIVGFHIILET